MMTPLATRTLAGLVLAVLSAVVLGISAHVESSSRTFGIKTATFTYDAFLGAFTIFAELVSAALRLSRQSSVAASLIGEVALASLYVVLWIAAGISTTTFTEQDRSVCKHVDDLFDLPEFEGLDADTLAAAKKIIKNVCSELHAELAMIWLAFILSLGVLGYLLFLALRHHSQGNKAIWYTSLGSYRKPVKNPFADPEGSVPGHHAGIADPNEEIVPGH